jgi:hypothetical protein
MKVILPQRAQRTTEKKEENKRKRKAKKLKKTLRFVRVLDVNLIVESDRGARAPALLSFIINYEKDISYESY